MFVWGKLNVYLRKNNNIHFLLFIEFIQKNAYLIREFIPQLLLNVGELIQTKLNLMLQENSFEAIHTCYQRINFKQSFFTRIYHWVHSKQWFLSVIRKFIPNNSVLPMLSEKIFLTALYIFKDTIPMVSHFGSVYQLCVYAWQHWWLKSSCDQSILRSAFFQS